MFIFFHIDLHLHSFSGVCFSALVFSAPSETRCFESSSGLPRPLKSFRTLPLVFRPGPSGFRLSLIARSRDPSGSGNGVVATTTVTHCQLAVLPGRNRRTRSKSIPPTVSREGGEGERSISTTLPSDPLVPRRCTICYSITKTILLSYCTYDAV